MTPRTGEPGSAPERRFFLADPQASGPPELAPGDLEHALRVLRLRAGDRLVGLDGRGGSWPLEVASAARDRLTLASLGEGRRDPPPGEEGAALPWIEVAVPWPKGGKVEEMLDRLTQLGAAAIAPLACSRAGPHSGELPPNRRERLERVLREACKQSGRTWLPVLRGEDPVRGASGKLDVVFLDPEAERSLTRWIQNRIEAGTTRWNSRHPLLVLVGPEGGFTPEERAHWFARGAEAVRLGAHVLRVETAAEAAMAVLGAALFNATRS
ncbi:MAG: RsmE family RNA methyltransferase [Planctomycetota bacterium]